MPECLGQIHPIFLCHQLRIYAYIRGVFYEFFFKEWLDIKNQSLQKNGIKVTFNDSCQSGGYSVNIDCEKFVGTISYWPKNIFEFQFNDCLTGDVIVLETVQLDTAAATNSYLDNLIYKKLLII